MIIKAKLEHASFIIESQLLMAKESEDLSLNPKIVKKGVEFIFNNPEHGYYLIYQNENKVKACLLILKEWSDWRAGFVLWIHSVYVRKEFRRQGLFSKMYEHLKNHVQSNDELKGLRLYVDKTNENAIKAYQKIGMSNEHYHMFEWLKDY